MSGMENLTAEQIRANQIEDLYRMLYPLIVRDFLHVEDARKLHAEINAQNLNQVLAFEQLRAAFNTHFHIVATASGPATSAPTTTVALIQMQPITSLPNTIFAQSLVEPPSPPFRLLPRKIGVSTTINPFTLE